MCKIDTRASASRVLPRACCLSLPPRYCLCSVPHTLCLRPTFQMELREKERLLQAAELQEANPHSPSKHIGEIYHDA